MKRALAAALAALTLTSCQTTQTTCDRNGGNACLSATQPRTPGS